MKMKVQEGLNQLKLLDKRIKAALRGVTMYDWETDTKPEAKLASFNALVKRRLAIQVAIQESNTRTMVTVSGATMSVAQAILYKNSLLEYTPIVEQKLRDDIYAYTTEKDRYTINEDNTIAQLLEASIANKSAFDETAIRKSLHKTLATKFDMAEELSSISKVAEDFLSAIDLVLTTSNVTTDIEIID